MSGLEFVGAGSKSTCHHVKSSKMFGMICLDDMVWWYGVGDWFIVSLLCLLSHFMQFRNVQEALDERFCVILVV